MAKRDPDRTVQRSVLDRLIDENPRTQADMQMSWTGSAQAFKESVRRDLEWLLNTRRTPEPASSDFVEVGRSLYHYGLPDISSMSADSSGTRTKLVREVELAIAHFEPRLANVSVSLHGEETGLRQVRFLVEGILRMDPAPEHVVFDTVLEMASGKFDVGRQSHA